MASFTLKRDSLHGLKGKTVLITGGSSGFGLESAKLLLSLSTDNRVAILDRAPLPASFRYNPERVFFRKVDITSWNAQRDAFAAAIEKFKGLDAVFVNAGIGFVGDQFFTDNYDTEGKLVAPDRRVLDVNISASSDTIKLAIHYLRKTPNGGSIIVTASIAGYGGTPGAPHYTASKHALVGLVRSLKYEVPKLKISISMVSPYYSGTGMVEGNPEGLSIKDWTEQKESQGLILNRIETVALAMIYLLKLGSKANGSSIAVVADKLVEVEEQAGKNFPGLLGKKLWNAMSRGQNVLVFPTL